MHVKPSRVGKRAPCLRPMMLPTLATFPTASGCGPTGDHPVPRTRHLNDISQDMRDGTYKKEFDCEGMSIVKIVLMQRMADHILVITLKSSGKMSEEWGQGN